MRDDLDKALVEKYPLIFKNRYADMKETAMCWGFCVGDGWYPLIDTLCGMLYSDYNSAKSSYDYILKNLGKPKFGSGVWSDSDLAEAKARLDEAEAGVPVASQVKEKFGTLRFYVWAAKPEHHNYINFAEELSGTICEKCGATHDVQTWNMGWMTTLCREHAIEAYGKDMIDSYFEKIEEVE